MSKKILFICQEPSRTGAASQLLELLKFIKINHPEWKLDVLFFLDGFLRTEFEQNVDEVFFRPINPKIIERIKNNIFQNGPYQKIKKNKYNYIFCNALLPIDESIRLKEIAPNAELILHYHDPQSLTEVYCNDKELMIKKLNYFEKIIAVSDLVEKFLIEAYQQSSQKVRKIYPFYALENQPVKKNIFEKKPNDFFIGVIGYQSYIKSTDLVSSIIIKLKYKNPNFNFKFLVIGGINREFEDQIIKDLTGLDLLHHLIFIPENNEVKSYLQLLDVFLMISREESFSLVTLEAIKQGVPTLTFDKNGGPCEIINYHADFLVKHLDIDDLCVKILKIHANKDFYKNKIHQVKKSIQNNFILEKQCKKIVDFCFQ